MGDCMVGDQSMSASKDHWLLDIIGSWCREWTDQPYLSVLWLGTYPSWTAVRQGTGAAPAPASSSSTVMASSKKGCRWILVLWHAFRKPPGFLAPPLAQRAGHLHRHQGQVLDPIGVGNLHLRHLHAHDPLQCPLCQQDCEGTMHFKNNAAIVRKYFL